MTNKKQPPPSAVEDQPWYPEWRAAVERVIAASMARDATMVGTPERKAGGIGRLSALVLITESNANRAAHSAGS